jgi:hypothetical protein
MENEFGAERISLEKEISRIRRERDDFEVKLRSLEHLRADEINNMNLQLQYMKQVLEK